MSKRRVVITGLGIISPVGSTVDTAWHNVVEGKSGIGPITRFDVSAWPVRFHGPVAGFEAEKYLSPPSLAGDSKRRRHRNAWAPAAKTVRPGCGVR